MIGGSSRKYQRRSQILERSQLLGATKITAGKTYRYRFKAIEEKATMSIGVPCKNRSNPP